MKSNKLWSILVMLVLVLGTVVTFSSCGDPEPDDIEPPRPIIKDKEDYGKDELFKKIEYSIIDRSSMNAKGTYVNDPLESSEIYKKYLYSFQFAFGVNNYAYLYGITKVVAHLTLDSGYFRSPKTNSYKADLILNVTSSNLECWDLFAVVSNRGSVTVSYTLEYFDSNDNKYHSIPRTDSFTINATK